MSSIGETVRGNVANLFGRFRPPAGMSPDEAKGVKAERLDFSKRLVDELKELDSPTDKIVRELRTVFRELQNQPFMVKMPTPEAIAASVREHCARGVKRPPCPACTKFGGQPGVHSDTDSGRIVKLGQVEVYGDWWCLGHHQILSWYMNRQDRFEDGVKFPYTSPTCLYPKEALKIGAPPGFYYEYTDGAFMGEVALWMREYLESETGKMLLDEPKILV